jgi:hypothetical protein
VLSSNMVKSSNKDVEVMTVQTSYISPWVLLSCLVVSEGMTDLLASYVLFLVSEKKATDFFTISSLNRKGTMSVVVRRREYCLFVCLF